MSKEKKQKTKIELPDGKVFEFIQRIQIDEFLQQIQKETPEMKKEKRKKTKMKIELPDGEIVEFSQKKQKDKLSQMLRDDKEHEFSDKFIEEEIEYIDNLPYWTIKFVTSEWYKEFLKTYPLNKYPSSLEILPKIFKIMENHIKRDNFHSSEKRFIDFFAELLYDLIQIVYPDYAKVIKKIDRKHKDMYHANIWQIMSIYIEWFLNNMDTNVKLDKKYNYK